MPTCFQQKGKFSESSRETVRKPGGKNVFHHSYNNHFNTAVQAISRAFHKESVEERRISEWDTPQAIGSVSVTARELFLQAAYKGLRRGNNQRYHRTEEIIWGKKKNHHQTMVVQGFCYFSFCARRA